MRLTLVYARTSIVELSRYPMFVAPTVVFPAVLFLLFAAPFSAGKDPNRAMAGFGAMAVLGIAFFQFGVGIAVDRTYAWESYLRTLPARPRVRVLARVASALVFAATAVLLVVLAAVATTDVSLSVRRWALLGLALAAGAVPLTLLGIGLGYWLRPKAALPVANLLFLPLAFVGGLWGGAEKLPGALAEVSPFLPTRQWLDLIAGAVDGELWRPRALAALAAFTVAFGLLATTGFRRDEGERFR